MSAVVRAKNAKGNTVDARILLDTCATANFVTEKFANALNLPTQICAVPIGAINGLTTISRRKMQITFYSRVSEFVKTLTFLTVPNIADSVPDEPFPRERFDIPSNVKLADPQFQSPRAIDMLIGAGPTLSLLSVGQIKIARDNYELVLQKTLLGWAIAGGASGGRIAEGARCKLLNLSKQLTDFWNIEEVGNETSLSESELFCEKHYLENTTRLPSGRYMVKLPFINEREFGNSRQRALRRFRALERKLNADAHLRNEYFKTMQESIDRGYMVLVENEALDDSCGYYMPHHAVIKPSSNTTKVRVVFDASAKTDRGISLNDRVHVGPTIQSKLFVQLLRFRGYVYGMTADIEKMYPQVLVHPDHRRYQRVFWYHEGKIVVYEIVTVTFGVGSAAFLAIRTLHKLADDERKDLPLGAEVVERDFYVDNLLTGANTLERILQIRDEVIEVLRRGGFNIRQWASNHRHALDTLDEKTIQLDCAIDEGSVANTLGIGWDARADQLVYSVKNIEFPNRITKRYILSEIAKIFDPLGLLGPVILYAKIIIQDCWKEKSDWDESIAQEICTRWVNFAKQLNSIQQFTVERRLLIDEPVNIEIHGFCDASERGYGACIYVRSMNARGLSHVRLACAKSRVAPVKSKTIPKLELCGAQLLVRLFNETRPAFDFKINRTVFWSDSTIVLHWIKKSPEELKIFEANRVKEIRALDNEVTWRHVRTNHNPADALSRGQLPNEFVKNRSVWLHGPAWISGPESEWPINIVATPRELPGLRASACLSTNVATDIFARFSSFKRMVKVMAFCLRWRKDNQFHEREIGMDERIATERVIFRVIQREQFADLITKLEQGRELKKSRLQNLDPFLDQHKLLRVGGRLKNANIPYDQRHPILLPSYQHVTDIIIREAHLETLHGGIQTTVYTTRLRFWLLDARNQARKIVRSCVPCTRFQPHLLHSKMGNLPTVRVTEAPVFSQVGTDYFGPILIKEKKFRNRQKIKAYGCLFVCMVTKAVHIEIVSDLTTEGFLAAFERFRGRRGFPSDVYSDNGTNFVGANNQLKEIYDMLNSKRFRTQVNAYAAPKNIKWHFSPPLSPHFGGLWDAGVKTFKHHFKRVVGEQLLTFEEINTLAIEIEAILNSRPLYTMSTDPNDPIAITPAHFLIGRPLTALPENDLTSVSANRLSTWHFITRARQDFWKKWYQEYLHELQKRYKWQNSNHHLLKDAVVLLIDKALPCMRWRLGTIIETHPGDDGIVRVVTVRTAQGVFKRNITQICPLPIIREE